MPKISSEGEQGKVTSSVLSQSLKEKLLVAVVGGVFYVLGVMTEQIIELFSNHTEAEIELADFHFKEESNQFSFVFRIHWQPDWHHLKY